MGYQKSVQSFTGLAWPGNRLPSCWLSACQHSLWVLVSWVPHFSFYPLALHSVFPPVLSSRSSFSSCYLHFFFLPNTCEYCHSSYLSMSLTFILYFLPPLFSHQPYFHLPTSFSLSQTVHCLNLESHICLHSPAALCQQYQPGASARRCSEHQGGPHASLRASQGC